MLYNLMACLLRSPALASSAVQSSLGYNVFHVGPPHVRGHYEVCFTTGQPLGFLSSWPLFALSHHWVVRMAAEKVFPGKLFSDYAVLGNDVVIGDREVALEYKAPLGDFGLLYLSLSPSSPRRVLLSSQRDSVHHDPPLSLLSMLA